MKLVIDHLSKSFGGHAVLRELCCEFPEGQTTVILGPSGQGKTTLLRILMRLETADGGTVTGVPEKLAAVFQEPRLCPRLSARKNVALVLPKGKEAAADELLIGLGLEKALDTPASDLSGGMARRVALARALAYDAPLLLLDEPFNGLDETTKTAVMAFTRERIRGKTVLLVTHDRQEADFFGGIPFLFP